MFVGLSYGQKTWVVTPRVRALLDGSLSGAINLKVSSVGDETFANSLISEVSGDAVQTLGMGAFSQSPNLTLASFKNVRDIGYGCFEKCEKLESVFLGSATLIGSYTFSECGMFHELVLGAPSVCKLSDSRTFFGTPISNGSGVIRVPAALVESYKTDTNWSLYANVIEAIPGS